MADLRPIPTPDPRWRLCTGKFCRYTHCGEPAVAEFERSHGSQTRWYAYCSAHLYGRVMKVQDPDLAAMLGQ